MVFRGSINICWFVFKWTLAVSAAAGVAIAIALYQRVDEEIRCKVQAKFQEHYQGLQVSVRAAQLQAGRGIEIRGLSLKDPTLPAARAELAYIDELFIACDTKLTDLVTGKLAISSVTVRRPIVRNTRLPDGSWTAAKLLPFPKFSEVTPTGTLENGAIELADASRPGSRMLNVRDANLRFAPGKPAVPGEKAPLAIEGSFSGDHLERVTLSLTMSAGGAVDCRGRVDTLHLSPELSNALPASAAARCESLSSIRGDVALDFQVNYESGQPPEFVIEGELNGGRTDDRRLPYPLSDMHGKFRFTPDSIEVSELTARSGATTLRAFGRMDGYAPSSPSWWHVLGRRLRIDQQLSACLPLPLQTFWHAYRPAGEINVDADFSYDGARWTPKVAVQCLGVGFECNKFPYRLEQGAGSIQIDDKHVIVDLVAYAGAQPVAVYANVNDPGPRFTGEITAKGKNIALDEPLFRALPAKARDVIRALHPQGTFDFSARLYRDDARQPLIHQHVNVAINRCTIRYERFPYPLSSVTGEILMRDADWKFRDFKGRNDTGLVLCSGDLAPLADGNSRLTLDFDGRNVPLEEELRDALPRGAQNVWALLRPRGAVNLKSRVTYATQDRKLTVGINAQPFGETVSIEPSQFPYRLEKLRGNFSYLDGQATFSKLAADHGSTHVTCNGQCTSNADGSWELRLENLWADRLHADKDAELVRALPDSLRKGLSQLRPVGAVDLHGSLAFSRSAIPDDPMKTSWDIALSGVDLSLNSGLKLEHMLGKVTLAGSVHGDDFTCQGRLDLDALQWNNLHFTEIRGPLKLEANRLLLGAWCDSPKPGRKPTPLTAKLYEGTLVGDAQVTLGATPDFAIQGLLFESDLKQFAQEYMSGEQKISGKVGAKLRVTGNARGLHTLRGDGNVQIWDANIYELPLMVSLLKILNMRSPDATAFTRSDVDFRLQGEHVLFDRLDFAGDAFSLHGQGQLGLDKQTNLTFHAMGAGNDLDVPILRGMLGEASQQIMQIHVDGSLDNPVVTNEAFPGVSKALEQLQSDLGRRRAAPDVTASRPSSPAGTVKR